MPVACFVACTHLGCSDFGNFPLLRNSPCRHGFLCVAQRQSDRLPPVNTLHVCVVAALAAGMGTVAGGCTKTNPSLCCISELDCVAIGLPNGTTCESGFTCAAHECVAANCSLDVDCADPLTPHCGNGLCRECAAAGHCGQTEPACNLNTYACEACSTDGDCSAFSTTPFCGISGACVACTKNEQCAAAQPVCGDDGNCRLCEHDQECASGACDGNGTCVAPANVLYISPTGIDAGGCVQTQPCASGSFASSLLTSSRFHIAFSPGTYQGILGLRINAPRFALHGNGAKYSFTATTISAPLLVVRGVKVFARDFEFTAIDTGIVGCSNNGEVELRNIVVRRADGASSADACKLTIADSEFNNAGGLFVSTNSQVFIKRVKYVDSYEVVNARNSVVAVENFVVLRPKANIFSFEGSTGGVSFGTIAELASAATAIQINCTTSPIAVTSSIIWSPTRPIIVRGSCVMGPSNIVGPTIDAIPPVPVTTIDPLFVDIANSNFRLQPTSPAIDKAETGPAKDIEGKPRPRGVRFDLGAYEAN